MKVKLLLLSMALSSACFAHVPKDERLELCVSTGPCAIPTTAKEIEGTIYIVREYDYETLANLWTGATFFVTNDENYDAARELLVSDVLTFPAVNPSAGVMERKGGTPAPAPKPAPSGGPLVSGSVSVGNITIGGGGGAQCTDCHTGSMKEIHGQVMKPKKDDK
jgi:hypothetical protein